MSQQTETKALSAWRALPCNPPFPRLKVTYVIHGTWVVMTHLLCAFQVEDLGDLVIRDLSFHFTCNLHKANYLSIRSSHTNHCLILLTAQLAISVQEARSAHVGVH